MGVGYRVGRAVSGGHLLAVIGSELFSARDGAVQPENWTGSGKLVRAKVVVLRRSARYGTVRSERLLGTGFFSSVYSDSPNGAVHFGSVALEESRLGAWFGTSAAPHALASPNEVSNCRDGDQRNDPA